MMSGAEKLKLLSSTRRSRVPSSRARASSSSARCPADGLRNYILRAKLLSFRKGEARGLLRGRIEGDLPSRLLFVYLTVFVENGLKATGFLPVNDFRDGDDHAVVEMLDF